MSHTIFVFSDPHFCQDSINTFKGWDGEPMRPFADAAEGDEEMIRRCNEIVRPQDHLYILGDISMKRYGIAKVGRMNGHKRLVFGNHDIYKPSDYLPYFEKFCGSRVLDGLLLTHYPVHPSNLPTVGTKKHWINCHGHIHRSMGPDRYFEVYGPRYYNVSCEMTDYRPVELGELKERIARQQDVYKEWREEQDTKQHS